MNYRKEIDGLRAIAILSVILFHAGFTFFKGGFIGVDIFFVISGFLMTSIILKEKEEGTFTLKKFYERRIRRIIPMLIFTLLIFLPLAYYYLQEKELMFYTKSAVRALFAISNIFFANNTGGYFDTATDFIPLIHTWTLGVEEQFYVILPLIFIILWKIGKNKLFVLLSYLIIISFFLNFVFKNATHNFYLLHTRFWELGIGSLIAFIKEVKVKDCSINFGFNSTFKVVNVSAKFVYNLISILSLITILLSTHYLHEKINNLQFRMLFPVVATALLIIFITKDTITYKILSLKPIRGIGLISYSAYLLHQPIFALVRTSSLETITKTEWALWSILTFIISYFTWRFVENPFRNKEKIKYKYILIGFIASIIFFSLANAITKKNKGFNDRFEMSEELKASFVWNVYEKLQSEGRIIKFAGARDPKYIIIGDSMISGIFEMLEEAEIPFKMINRHGFCPTFINPSNEERINKIGNQHLNPCFETRNKDFEESLNSGVKNIIFASLSPFAIAAQPQNNITKEESLKLYERGVDYFFSKLLEKNIKIYIIPYWLNFGKQSDNRNLYNLKNKHLTEATLNKRAKKRQDVEEEWQAIEKIFFKYKDNPNVKVVKIHDLLCDKKYCLLGTNKYIQSPDNVHLGLHSINLIEDRIKKEILDDIKNNSK